MKTYSNEQNDIGLRPKRLRVPLAIALALALLFSPLIYEGGKVLAARWMSLAGTYHEADTPALNALGELTRSVSFDVRRYSSGVLGTNPLGPSKAVPLGIAWAVLMAVVFLRRVS